MKMHTLDPIRAISGLRLLNLLRTHTLDLAQAAQIMYTISGLRLLKHLNMYTLDRFRVKMLRN